MTAFAKGERVVSRVDAQGMTKGEAFTVVDTHTKWVLGMGFTTFFLKGADGRVLPVGNGHLVLEAAPEAK